MRIALNRFSGMRPGVAPHLLGGTEAQVAHNCLLEKGDLRPLRAPSLIQALASVDVLSIFQYSENSNTHWVESDNDIDAVANAAPNDAYERMFFTGESEPRFFANDNISGGGFDPAADYLKLGIPAPAAAPTVGRAGSAGSTYRAYFYCYLNRYGDAGSNSPIGTISDYDSGRVLLTDIADAPTQRAIDRIWVFRTASSTSGTSEFEFVLEAFFFDEAESYAVGDFVVYSGQVYECTTAHTGAWNASNFTAGEAVDDSDLGSVFAFKDYYPAPDGAAGLMVLSNGVYACFYGNTLYMSEPWKPWAFAYQKSVKAAIVGIAALGTSIVVCTAAGPVRYYGQHPSSMAAYDYPDALPCEEKRTIATGQGMVCYRAPNGLAAVNTERAWLITASYERSASRDPAATIIDAKSWADDFAPQHGYFFNDLYFGFSASTSFYIDLSRRFAVRLGVLARAAHVTDAGAFYIAAQSGTTMYVQLWEGDDQNYLAFTWRGRLEVFGHKTNMAYGLVLLDAEFLAMVSGLVDLAALNTAIFAGDINGALRDRTLRDATLRGDDLYALSGFAISDASTLKLYADGELLSERTLAEVENHFSLDAIKLYRRVEVEVSGYVPAELVVLAGSPEEVMGIGDNKG